MSSPFIDPDGLPLTITQLSLYLKQHIEQAFSYVYMQGEISGCKRHSSGHVYLSLKDESSVIDAICWKGTKVATLLHDGAFVACKGRITTYGARSKYQFIIESAELAGQGALLQKIEALKAKLLAEGLFDVGRKKTLPRFPCSIGLITSPTGAVIQDMLHRFAERFPCRLILYPVSVQGSSTVREVCQALGYFQNQKEKMRPSVIIIARGGGSIEDLWAFHDEAVVRAVASCVIPIISAIGHETDTTLIDFAADIRSPTPTAAAEIAVPLYREVVDTLYGYQRRLFKGLYHRYEISCIKFSHLRMRLDSLAHWDGTLSQHLDEVFDRFYQAILTFLQKQKAAFLLAYRGLRVGRKLDFSNHQRCIAHYVHCMHQAIRRFLSESYACLNAQGRLLMHLSYQRTLERGFTLIHDEQGALICSATALAKKKSHHGRLAIQFFDQSVFVQTIENDNV